ASLGCVPDPHQDRKRHPSLERDREGQVASEVSSAARDLLGRWVRYGPRSVEVVSLSCLSEGRRHGGPPPLFSRRLISPDVCRPGRSTGAAMAVPTSTKEST